MESRKSPYHFLYGRNFPFIVITTDANDLMKTIHDRMPVILPESAYDQWLDPDEKPDKLQTLLVPFAGKELEAYPISTFVNTPKNQGPKCIEPAA